MVSRGINKGNNKWKNYLIISFFVIVIFIFVFENADANFQSDSEELALGPIVAVIKDIEIDTNGYGLGFITSLNNPESGVQSIINSETIVGYVYSNYTSQVGLQGFAYRVIARFIPNFNIIITLNRICCLLLVIVIVAIVIQLYKRFGLLFSASFGITTVISPWVINFSRNLYWVEFTWFIPMLLGLLCLNYRNKRKLLYPLFYIAILVKCLCGYEYISTIMMSSLLFLIVEWICNKTERKQISKAICIIGIVSVFGFFTAYAIHACIYGSGNILQGFKMLWVDLVGRRTFGNPANYDKVYADSLNATVIDVLIRYFWSSGSPFDGKFMLIINIATIFSLICRIFILKKDSKFEVSIYTVSLLSTLSWLVLGKSHSFIHTHMNFVLFYMGWVQSCFYIIIKNLLEQRKLVLKISKE